MEDEIDHGSSTCFRICLMMVEQQPVVIPLKVCSKPTRTHLWPSLNDGHTSLLFPTWRLNLRVVVKSVSFRKRVCQYIHVERAPTVLSTKRDNSSLPPMIVAEWLTHLSSILNYQDPESLHLLDTHALMRVIFTDTLSSENRPTCLQSAKLPSI